jgi:Ni/Co efflux regulator RcnB
MKRFAIVVSICTALFLGGALTVFAQDDHRDDRRDDHHDARQEERHDEMRHDEVRHEEARHEEQMRRIDDEHFRAHFGHDHHFAIRHVTIVEGRSHFAYGGYNFAIVEPWPAGWSYNDNCYIDFVDGGYYLFNLRHPGVRVSVNVF